MKNKNRKEGAKIAYSEAFARCYDALMSQEKYKRWEELIGEITKKYSIQRGLCVDVACGTGNITRILLRLGFEVVGVDSSMAMLSVARRKFPHVKFLKADIRNFAVPKAIGPPTMAVSFYDSLNYLLSEGDVLRAFKAVASNLVEGGFFIFDMNTKEHVACAAKNTPKIHEGENFYCVFRYGSDNGLWLLNIDFFLKEDNGLYRLYREQHTERGYNEEDIIPLLEKAGLMCLEVVKDNKIYENGGEQPSRLYFVCKKLG